MSSTPASLAAGLIDATVELIWRQWGPLGGSVSVADRVSGHAHAIIDPEALLLGSLCLAERERRFDDVAASWVKTNSTLLSVQRLKNLLPAFPRGAAARLGGAADVAIAGKDLRWASIAHPGREPLGRDNKLRATQVRFLHSATLMLQLRQGMGVGVKADVLSYLLATWHNGRSWASTAAVTEAIGYTSAAVRRAADDLARARFIDLPNVASAASMSQRMYSAEPARWVQTLGVGNIEPGWRFWRERFSLVAAILETERQLEGKPVSDYALGVTLRELLEAHRSAFVRNDAVREDVLLDGGDDWVATFSAATMALATWIRNSG